MPSPSPFAIADFRFYWVARLASTIAQMMHGDRDRLAGLRHRPPLTMGLKAASFQLGLIGVVQFVPLFALTLVTGWTADRLDRRSIARATIALELLCAAILGWLAWTGATQPCPLCSPSPACSASPAPSRCRRCRRWRPTSCRARSCRSAIAMSSIAWQVGRDRRARDRRLSLRARAAACLMRWPAACSPCRSSACS